MRPPVLAVPVVLRVLDQIAARGLSTTVGSRAFAAAESDPTVETGSAGLGMAGAGALFGGQSFAEMENIQGAWVLWM